MREYFSRMKRRRQVRRELHSMSDNELRDLGLSRYDIERIVNETE